MPTLVPTGPLFPVVARYRCATGLARPSYYAACVGTAFSLDHSGTLVTAAHVLEKTIGDIRPIEDGPPYSFLDWMIAVAGGGKRLLFPITNTQICGNDIALVKVDSQDVHRTTTISFGVCLRLRPAGTVEMGTAVSWSGYPESHTTAKLDAEHLEIQSVNIWMQTRLQRGHITTVYKQCPPYFPGLPTPAYELSLPVLPGMSGAPLVEDATSEVIGIVSKGRLATVPVQDTAGIAREWTTSVGIAVDIAGFSFHPLPGAV